MTDLELLNIIYPGHDRTSCDDHHTNNGFYSIKGGNDPRGRCKRCMILELIRGEYDIKEIVKGVVPEQDIFTIGDLLWYC
jgi:hypothetical protein